MKTGWHLYSLLTTTGEVGSELDPTSGSWSIELNKTESLQATVKKSKLRGRQEKWWHPWSGGLLLTFTSNDGVERPIVAGPITDWGAESRDELSFTGAGIRAIFEHRTVWADLAYKDMTYGDIAWALIQHGMDRSGGSLPIVHGIPQETGRYQRTYEKWNLQNNTIDKRLTELSEVINGPDMMFRPRWVDDTHRRIEWVLVHGTAFSPYIPQDWQPDFDTTAAASGVQSPSIRSTGKSLRSRIWYTGAGEGEGIVREYAEDLTDLEEGMPFLEEVFSDSDQDTPEILRNKAGGALATASHMVDQVTFSVRANSTKAPWGSYFVGDTASVTLKGWISVPDGTRNMRIIKANGGLDMAVTLDFQEAVWE